MPQASPPVPVWLLKLTGAIASAFGAGLAALCVWALYRIVLVGAGASPGVFTFFLVVVPTAVFCLLVGFRLLFNRPNRHGSLLPLSGWLFLALLFSAVVVIGLVVVLRGELYAMSGSLLPAIAFASLSFRAYRAAKQSDAVAR